MTFLDKLKESAKAFAEQTKIIAKNVSEKAEVAMEIQKLSNGIEKHKQNRNEAYKKIGQYIYEKFSQEEDIPLGFSYSLQHHYCFANAEIDTLTNEIALIKMEQFGGPSPTVTCPHCKKEIPYKSKFCPQCGYQLEEDINEAPILMMQKIPPLVRNKTIKILRRRDENKEAQDKSNAEREETKKQTLNMLLKTNNTPSTSFFYN